MYLKWFITEGCTKDLLSIGLQLEKDNHALSQTISTMDMDYLKSTSLEYVLLEAEWEPRDLDSSNILNRLIYWSETMQCAIFALKLAFL